MDSSKSIREYIESFVSEHANLSSIPFQRKILKTNLSLAGVSLPTLRKLSKNLLATFGREEILSSLDLSSLDEQIVFELVVNGCPYDEFVSRMHQLLELADSWVITDTVSYDFFKTSPSACVSFCEAFLSTDAMLKQRQAFIFMLKYLVPEFSSFIVEKIKLFGSSQEHLLQMAIAWTMQVLFLEDKDSVLRLLNDSDVCFGIKIKAIQKLIDSRKVSSEDKDSLRELRSALRNNTQTVGFQEVQIQRGQE